MLLAVLAALTWRQSQAFSNLETACRRTIAENPVCWLAHYNLAVVLGQQGQADEAIAHYRKTLEIVPDNAGAHNNLGSILAAQGHLDDAVFHLRGALKSDPHNATTHVNLGYTLRTAATSTRPYPFIGRPSKSIPIARRPTTILAPSWPPRVGLMKR